jgi:hypothetical protein
VRTTVHVVCALAISLLSYSAGDSWRTLELRYNGTPATAVVTTRQDSWSPHLYYSVPKTVVSLAFQAEAKSITVAFELPRGTAGAEVGQKVSILYDKWNPMRILHPWAFLIEDRLKRSVAGIVVFGAFWIGLIKLTRMRLEPVD